MMTEPGSIHPLEAFVEDVIARDGHADGPSVARALGGGGPVKGDRYEQALWVGYLRVAHDVLSQMTQAGRLQQQGPCWVKPRRMHQSLQSPEWREQAMNLSVRAWTLLQICIAAWDLTTADALRERIDSGRLLPPASYGRKSVAELRDWLAKHEGP